VPRPPLPGEQSAPDVPPSAATLLNVISGAIAGTRLDRIAGQHPNSTAGIRAILLACCGIC
jgi:hypothetical protein